MNLRNESDKRPILYTVNCLLLVFAVRFIRRELLQYSLVHGRTHSWLAAVDAWNVIDLSSQLLLILIALLSFAGEQHLNFRVNAVAYAVCSQALMVKLLAYFRGFKSYSKLVGILLQNVKDMTEFLVILLVLLFFYAISFMMMYNTPEAMEVNPILLQFREWHVGHFTQLEALQLEP